MLLFSIVVGFVHGKLIVLHSPYRSQLITFKGKRKKRKEKGKKKREKAKKGKKGKKHTAVARQPGQMLCVPSLAPSQPGA